MTGADRFKILQTIKLSRLEFSRLQRSLDDHIDDSRRQAINFYNIGSKLLVERRFEFVEDRIVQSAAACSVRTS